MEPAPPVPLAKSHRPRFHLYLYLAIGGLILIAIAAVAWKTARGTDELSLAVLPFKNVTADPADQYFSDGVTDELADLMNRYAKVKTIARSKTYKYRTGTANLRPVAEQLHARYMVKGSVERSRDLVTIIASLVRGSDGSTLWTNTYRRQAGDLTAIEEDLAGSISRTLGLGVPIGSKTHVPVAAAHDLYLKGRYELRQTTSAANAMAQGYFRDALKLDPEYVFAYHGLAEAIWNENIWAGTTPVMSERRKSEELWQKAIELDPGFTPAHSGLAAYAMQYDWDWQRAERELKTAMSIDDNSGVEQNYATLCLIRGRRGEADAHRERAKLFDPDGLGRLANDVNAFILEGRWNDARVSCEEWMRRSPNAAGPKLILAQILSHVGKGDAALKLLAALPKETAGVPMALAQVKAASGDAVEARRMLAALEEKYAEGRLFAYDFATAYAELHDERNAVQWMRRSMDAREGPAMYIRIDPQLAAVQKNPDFRALKKRMDLDW